MVNNVKLANIRMLQFIAEKLGNLRDELVFLGGCTTAIFIDEPGAPDVRYTLDVDCIVDVISLNQYHQIEKKLGKLGFTQSVMEEVICRWRYDNVILDVMPTDEKILGFGNRWYKEAIKYAINYFLTDKISIKVISAPYFLATKIEAFKTRGNTDFYASHDFEDIVTVLDGRSNIVNEIEKTNPALRHYLVNEFGGFMSHPSFSGALPGHLIQYGKLAEDRMEFCEQKLKSIISST